MAGGKVIKKLTEHQAWKEILKRIINNDAAPWLCHRIRDLECEGKISYRMTDRLLKKVFAEGERMGRDRATGEFDGVWPYYSYERISWLQAQIKATKPRRKEK